MHELSYSPRDAGFGGKFHSVDDTIRSIGLDSSAGLTRFQSAEQREQCGYSKKSQNIVPSVLQMKAAYKKLGLNAESLDMNLGQHGVLGDKLHAYFAHRDFVLRSEVEPFLMNTAEAKKEFHLLKSSLNPSCPLPMNKQKKEKRAEAFLTRMVNMLIEKHAKGVPVDYDPRNLTTVTANGAPLRTLARRVDGAIPSTVDPIAIWEIKEYYYTTTFGSRVADGVYISLLDGMELEELRTSDGVDVLHYLILDAYFTWWKSGRSYLCRIVDMLHMGYVDEVIVGREVLTRLPLLVGEWLKKMEVK